MRSPSEGPRGRHGQFERGLSTVERDTEAARLRDEENLTYQEIAERLGFGSKGAACHAVERALRSVPVKVVSTLRARSFARLELMWEALLPGIEAGDTKSIAEGRKVCESLRRLFDIDGPVDADTETDAEVDEITKLLAEADAIVKGEQEKIYRAGGGNAH